MIGNKFVQFFMSITNIARCDTYTMWGYTKGVRSLNRLFLNKRYRLEFTKSAITNSIRMKAQGLSFYVMPINTALSVSELKILFTDSIAAMCEKTGTREWNKTDTPPTTITLSTLRHSAAIFRRTGTLA